MRKLEVMIFHKKTQKILMLIKTLLLVNSVLLFSCRAKSDVTSLTEGKQLQQAELLIKQVQQEIKDNNLDDAYKNLVYLINEIPLFVQLDDDYFIQLDELIKKLKKLGKNQKIRDIYLLLNHKFSLNPRNIIWLEKLANSYYDDEEWLDAQVYYEELARRYPTGEQAVHAHLQLASIFLKKIHSGNKRGDYILQANIQLQLIKRKGLEFNEKQRQHFELIRKKLMEVQAQYLLYLANFYKKSRPGYALTKIRELISNFSQSSVIGEAKKLELILKKQEK